VPKRTGRPPKFATEAERRAAQLERMRCWRAAHVERCRQLKRESTARLRAADPVRMRERERKKLAAYRRGARPVMRRWYFEQFRRHPALIRAELEADAYAVWFEALDDLDVPPGVDLSAALWGSAPRARDGAR
jgi:hypothetical protein